MNWRIKTNIKTCFELYRTLNFKFKHHCLRSSRSYKEVGAPVLSASKIYAGRGSNGSWK